MTGKVSRILSKRTLLLFIPFIGFTLSFTLLHYLNIKGSGTSTTPRLATRTTLVKQEGIRPGLPLRLQIPKLNVNAALDHVGLTPTGELDTPKGPLTAGWYEYGARPGEKGSAVIDGHFGWSHGRAAVFDNLHSLQKGDKLSTKDGNGKTKTFVVRTLRTYRKDENAEDVFRSSDDKAHLNLITCGGVWNEAEKSYANRLVVFADLVFSANNNLY